MRERFSQTAAHGPLRPFWGAIILSPQTPPENLWLSTFWGVCRA